MCWSAQADLVAGAGTAAVGGLWVVIALPLLPLRVPAGVLATAPPHARPRILAPPAAGIATAAVCSVVLLGWVRGRRSVASGASA